MSIITSSDLPTGERGRSSTDAMRRGFAHKCPACGKGALFTRYLEVAHRCPECGEDLYHHRADD
ncbi:MAG TPA: DUF983 domain-containing protein, partial [Hyphomicrobium sp.]